MAGNSFSGARTLRSNNFTVRDALGRRDRADFFRLVFDQTSRINVRLSLQQTFRQSANADLALFNANRNLLKQSTRKGTRTETIRRSIEPGVYYLRVQRRSGDLRYQLSGSATAQPPAIQFSQSVYQVTEGETKPLILTRTGSTAGVSQVQVNLSDGSTTLTGFPFTVTFNPGETRREVSISIFQDALREDIQTASFQLTSLSQNAIANSRTRLQILDDDRPFNIEFDYRFDTAGWFTPEKKAALEAAANFWEKAIQTDFPIAPAGLRVPFIFNPQTDTRIDNFAIDRSVDDLVVFVGARDLGGLLGAAKSIGDLTGTDYPDFQAGYLGSRFEPWLGVVSFDRSTSFFIDSTPETRDDIPVFQFDFIDTAIHELGHVLGIAGFANAFFNQINSSNVFIGENARQFTNNVGIPITANFNHIEDRAAIPTSGKPSMATFGERGRRFLPTVLDLAILDDIGYQIDYSAASLNSFPSSNFSRMHSQTSLEFARCACASCLMS